MALKPAPILSPSTNGTFDNLPPEILLEVIPYIPYTPGNIASLGLTCRKLNDLIRTHEHGLVMSIKTAQFSRRTLDLFPGLPDTYHGLRRLHYRLVTLEEVHTQWLRITSYSPELHWLKGRWEQIHKAGLLLLYRVQDAGPYEEELALMQRLPATSLACLLFKLISSIHILRVYGPEPINASYARHDMMVRSDVELAFEELLLQHGPDFFVAMLRAEQSSQTHWTVCALQAEIAGMEERQLPTPDGEPKPPTLISSFRRALAVRVGCEISQTVTKMWTILSSTGFDDVDEEMVVRIVHGKEVEKGMRRIF